MYEFAKIVVITVFILIVGTFIVAFINYILKEQQVKADTHRLQELYPNILEGASTNPVVVSVDYNRPISQGSPLIFGGNHAPDIGDIAAWDQIAEIGITSIRKDLFPDKVVPQTTIQNYKNNINGVADPLNWNETEINKVKDAFIQARKRGMSNIAILAYTPKWLTHNGKDNGVPQDWEVFEDIAKKIYKIHRENIDYIEIWNEPDWQVFLDIQNSGQTREEVYEKMFYYGAKAIREVDEEINDGKRVPIGGPTASDTQQGSLLNAILVSDRASKYLDFVSYHNYELKEDKLFPEPSWDIYTNILKNNNANKPIFITEWNYTANSDKPYSQNTGIEGLLFTANKFLDYLTMGLSGANYHVIEPLRISKPNEGDGYFGFYRIKNGKTELVSQAKAWRILSNKMGLGTGRSQIYNVTGLHTNNMDIKAIGFANHEEQKGIILVNESIHSLPIEILLKETKISNYAKIQVYEASDNNDSTKPKYDGLLKMNKASTSFKYYIPKQSVIAIKITEEKVWYDKLKFSF
ncbi:MAG TPA: hypothetical protein PLS49_00440 [Candidatus Woesebacteria bacterium]|nr:hypothetical protein [Candidatus Woesebacteria bacterium]